MEWFKLHTCWGDALDMLTDEEAGRVFKSVYAYALRKEVRKGSGREDVMTAVILETLKRDIEKYEAGAAEEERKKEQKRLHAQKAAQARWKQAPGQAGASAPDDGHADGCGGQDGHPRAWQKKEEESETEKEKKTEAEEREGNGPGLPAEAAELPVITIPLSGGGEFPVFRKDADEYGGLYPGVNVAQELRNMRGWCLGNPGKRKTRRGVRAFISSWLARAQKEAEARQFRENPFLPYARGEKTCGGMNIPV